MGIFNLIKSIIFKDVSIQTDKKIEKGIISEAKDLKGLSKEIDDLKKEIQAKIKEGKVHEAVSALNALLGSEELREENLESIRTQDRILEKREIAEINGFKEMIGNLKDENRGNVEVEELFGKFVNFGEKIVSHLVAARKGTKKAIKEV